MCLSSVWRLTGAGAGARLGSRPRGLAVVPGPGEPSSADGRERGRGVAMENWLDILARSVAGGGVSRRTTLRAMGAGLVAALLRSPASSYAGNGCDPNPCGPH